MSAASKSLSYSELESELLNAVNMSEVACRVLEGAGRRSSDGLFFCSEEMELISFSVYHANALVRELKSKWDEIHESNLAAGRAEKGGAA